MILNYVHKRVGFIFKYNNNFILDKASNACPLNTVNLSPSINIYKLYIRVYIFYKYKFIHSVDFIILKRSRERS